MVPSVSHIVSDIEHSVQSQIQSSSSLKINFDDSSDPVSTSTSITQEKSKAHLLYLELLETMQEDETNNANFRKCFGRKISYRYCTLLKNLISQFSSQVSLKNLLLKMGLVNQLGRILETTEAKSGLEVPRQRLCYSLKQMSVTTNLVGYLVIDLTFF